MQEWFPNAKFGIFIHWGIYAVEGTSESWAIFSKERTYDAYMNQWHGFTAARYDPRAWAELFRRVGIAAKRDAESREQRKKHKLAEHRQNGHQSSRQASVCSLNGFSPKRMGFLRSRIRGFLRTLCGLDLHLCFLSRFFASLRLGGEAGSFHHEDAQAQRSAKNFQGRPYASVSRNSSPIFQTSPAPSVINKSPSRNFSSRIL